MFDKLRSLFSGKSIDEAVKQTVDEGLAKVDVAAILKDAIVARFERAIEEVCQELRGSAKPKAKPKTKPKASSVKANGKPRNRVAEVIASN